MCQPFLGGVTVPEKPNYLFVLKTIFDPFPICFECLKTFNVALKTIYEAKTTISVSNIIVFVSNIIVFVSKTTMFEALKTLIDLPRPCLNQK